MMTLVIDASVAVKWVCREPGTDAARALFHGPDPLIAPDWLLVEVASTLWKKVKRSELLDIHAERHLRGIPDFFSRFYDAKALVHEAWRLSVHLHHAVYDCIYLALAQREDCRLVTADIRFFAALAKRRMDDRAVLLSY